MYLSMSHHQSRSVVTSSDYSSIPFIISVFVGITNVLAVAAKIATKSWMGRRVEIDDAAVVVSFLFSIGMIICTCAAANNGLGMTESALNHSQLINVAKLTYAADLLYIATLFFSKASMLIIIRWLIAPGGPLMAIWVTAGALIAWTVSALFVTAFQCSVPQVWNTVDGSCINMHAFWTYYDAFNILLEIVTSILPVFVIYGVQIARDRKKIIIAVFLLRIFVLAPLIADMYFQQRTSLLQSDPTLGRWPIAVCMQLVQCLSIVFACIPFLKPFFESLETGMVRFDDTKRMASRTTTINSNTGGSRSTQEASRKMSQRNSQNWTKVSGGPTVSVEPIKSGSSNGSDTDSNHIYTSTTFSVVEEAEKTGEQK